jgi:transcriptional regulator with XRE-family HTH domain
MTGILECMTVLHSQQATNWREGRRLRAWELFQEGWPQQRIAAALGVTKGAVSQWLSRAKAPKPYATASLPVASPNWPTSSG